MFLACLYPRKRLQIILSLLEISHVPCKLWIRLSPLFGCISLCWEPHELLCASKSQWQHDMKQNHRCFDHSKERCICSFIGVCFIAFNKLILTQLLIFFKSCCIALTYSLQPVALIIFLEDFEHQYCSRGMRNKHFDQTQVIGEPKG